MVAELIEAAEGQGIGIFLISHDIHDVMDALRPRLGDEERPARRHRARSTDVTEDDILGMIILGKKPAQLQAQG